MDSSLLFFVLLPIILLPFSGGTPTSEASSPERLLLLKDALGWMTFRKNGELLTDSELEPLFLQDLQKVYKTKKPYRSFVTAFQQGVLPRLTLNEGDRCDPVYRRKYRHHSNHSVTSHYQKNFTFEMYDKRESSGAQFCDYRQGLVCSLSSRRCECPEGSEMVKITPTSAVERCLLKENQVCALIDLANGNDPKHSELTRELPFMIFNLDKPLGCQSGTQCRFQSGNKNTPLCYDSAGGAWETGSWKLKLGDTCALGLYGDAGACEVTKSFDTTCRDANRNPSEEWPGMICYNFGSPRSSGRDPMDSKVGVCHYENGQHGIIPSDQVSPERSGNNCFIVPYVQFFLSVYIHPGTVPVRGAKLRDYYQKIRQVYEKQDQIQVFQGRCSVDKTNRWKEIWEYFEGLEADPPPGQDYVLEATEAKLDAQIQAILDLEKEPQKKMCKVYFSYVAITGASSIQSINGVRSILYVRYAWYDESASECKPDSSPDADGNDGTCESIPGLGRPALEKQRNQQDTNFQATFEQMSEFRVYRQDVLDENPELPCDPTRAPLPSLKLRSFSPLPVLEGGECLDGSVCYQDFSDARDVFDADCKLKSDAKQLLLCHEVDITNLAACEKTHVTRLVNEALHHLADYASLTKGEPCHPDFERAVRENDTEILAKYNPYQIMNWLDRGLLCDRYGKNLECRTTGFCDCINGNCLKERKPKGSPRPKGTGGEEGGEGGEEGDEDNFRQKSNAAGQTCEKITIIAMTFTTFISKYI